MEKKKPSTTKERLEFVEGCLINLQRICSKQHDILEKLTNVFTENFDGWIKTINGRLGQMEGEVRLITPIRKEDQSNIQHNYELIYGLKDEMETLKQEINAIKLIQIISLKQKMSINDKKDIANP